LFEEARVVGWLDGILNTRFGGAGVQVYVSQKKWDKTQQLLRALKDTRGASVWMNHKVLERIRGFLIYVLRTYPPMVPFIKVLNLTIDNWRPDQEGEGWKLRCAQIEAKFMTDKAIDLTLGGSYRPVSAGKPPLKAKAADRLKHDTDVLLTLVEYEMPRLRRI
jgi:hypothetical protein